MSVTRERANQRIRELEATVATLRQSLEDAEAEVKILRRACGEDSDELREEVRRRREAFRAVLMRAETAEAKLEAACRAGGVSPK